MLCYGCLSLIMIIPCALNILIITFYSKISEIIGFSFGTVIYSSKQIIFTVVYLIIMLFVTASDTSGLHPENSYAYVLSSAFVGFSGISIVSP